MYNTVQTKVRELGFGSFLSLPSLKVDKGLLMALAERWSLVTRTFHLPIGEIGLPPINFFMMTGLPMDGLAPLTVDEATPELV